MVIFLAWAAVFFSVNVGQAADVAATDVLQTVRDHLKGKMKASGTLDLYDNQEDKVRNLRTLKFPETIELKDGAYLAVIEYMDTKDGAKVLVGAVVEEKDNVLAVSELKIREVQAVAAKQAAQTIKKEYTDADIQQVMTAYLDQQTKFSGSLPLFDAQGNKLRKLALIKLDPQVRKLGIYNISGAEFKDVESNDKLDVDITVENKKGQLAVQSLRIRKVTKASP